MLTRLAAIFLLLTRSALSLTSCYHGRVFDKDVKENDARVPFVDNVTVVHNCSTCCVTFVVSNCCNRHGNSFTIADGTCGTPEMCQNKEKRREVCEMYEADECRHETCDSGDLCNSLDFLD